MKTWFVLLAVIYSGSAFASTTIDQLHSSCSGTLTILSTSQAYYSPSVPYNGRFGGTPASAGFSAQAAFKPQTSDCADFLKKYHPHLQFEVSVGAPADSQHEIEQIAAHANGKTVAVTWSQQFPFSFGHDLPFFDKFHEEEMNISGTSGKYSISQSFQVDSKKIYGVPTVEQLDDKGKLALAKEIVDYQLQAVKQPGWKVPFVDLLAFIEPTDTSLKAEYLQTLIGLFKSLDPNHIIGFFDFNVGGSDGAALANKIVELAIETHLGQDQVQELTFLFPAFFTIETTSGCLPITKDLLKTDLQQWLASDLNYAQKSSVSGIAQDLQGSVIYGFCLQQFKPDAELAGLAKQLTDKLHIFNQFSSEIPRALQTQ
jgi:hypothetical protein